MAKTVNKHIRIDADVWGRLETAAIDRNTTANRLIAELATHWLMNHQWPSTEVQIQVARASLFTAQAMVRDMAFAGRHDQIDKIRRYISTIVPDPLSDSPTAKPPDAKTSVSSEEPLPPVPEP